jgi:small nuclear ribonucleoprotein (snRNP)-like protein
MKRISDFLDCRINMKEMAALNGGSPTSASSTYQTSVGCGDTVTVSLTDGHDQNGKLQYYDGSIKVAIFDCGGYSVVTTGADTAKDFAVSGALVANFS